MALTDNFNSYSTGDLNGQGSWSGSTSFDVSTTSPQEGANCVENLSGGATTYTISKSFTSVVSGTQIFYMKMSDSLGDYGLAEVVLLSGTTELAIVRMAEQNVSGTKFKLTKGGGSEADLGSLSTSWRAIEVEWDASTEGVRARVDSGSWSSWITDGTSFTSIDKVTLRKVTVGSGTVVTYYWDNFLSGFTTTTLETTTMTETSVVARGASTTILDTMSLTEVITAIRGRVATVLETVSLTETFSSLVRWIRQTLSASSWSNSSKNTSVITNQNKSVDPTWTNQNQS